jgi:hypothetical protein
VQHVRPSPQELQPAAHLAEVRQQLLTAAPLLVGGERPPARRLPGETGRHGPTACSPDKIILMLSSSAVLQAGQAH